jgi:hypothetical protein
MLHYIRVRRATAAGPLPRRRQQQASREGVAAPTPHPSQARPPLAVTHRSPPARAGADGGPLGERRPRKPEKIPTTQSPASRNDTHRARAPVHHHDAQTAITKQPTHGNRHASSGRTRAVSLGRSLRASCPPLARCWLALGIHAFTRQQRRLHGTGNPSRTLFHVCPSFARCRLAVSGIMVCRSCGVRVQAKTPWRYQVLPREPRGRRPRRRKSQNLAPDSVSTT